MRPDPSKPVTFPMPSSITRLSFCFAATALLSVALYAQSVEGTVTDPDGIPVAGTKIEVLEAGLETWADAYGDFTLPGLPAGTHTVRALSKDFAPHPAAIALLQSARRPREVLHEDFPGWHSGLLAGMKDEVHHGSMLFKPLVHRQRKKGQGR